MGIHIYITLYIMRYSYIYIYISLEIIGAYTYEIVSNSFNRIRILSMRYSVISRNK